jgi:TonB family protein
LFCAALTASAWACGPKPVPVLQMQTEGGTDTDTRYTDRPPLGDPPGIDATAPAADYLTEVASFIQPAWASFLEDCRVRLPATHPLNEDALLALIEISMDTEGQVLEVAMVTSSGNPEFDQVAEEVAGDLRGLPKPPGEWISDDDRVHVTWGFARDRRQAGAASASLRRVELPLASALPKLLEAGAIATASRRILKAEESDGTELHERLQTVVSRVLELALAEEDPKLATMALEAVAGGKLKDFATQARAAVQSTDQRVALAAVKALGVVGDSTDVELLAALARGRSAASPELSAAAAVSLVSLGKGAQTREAALTDLTGKDPTARLAGLAVFSSVDGTNAVAVLSRILSGAQKSSRAERVAAATALGKQAVKSPAALKSLLAGTGTSDAAVRTSCVSAIALAAGAGLRSRLAYWKVLELVRNKDERVRAASIRAAAQLDPTRFAKELRGIRAGGSKLVVLSIASVLGDLPGDLALARLLDLASVSHIGMRTAAATGLAKRKGDKAASAVQVLLTDESPVVREAALSALTNEQQLTPFLRDEAQSVQSAALSTIVLSLGTAKTSRLVTSKLAASGSDRASQVLWARAWLVHP